MNTQPRHLWHLRHQSSRRFAFGAFLSSTQRKADPNNGNAQLAADSFMRMKPLEKKNRKMSLTQLTQSHRIDVMVLIFLGRYIILTSVKKVQQHKEGYSSVVELKKFLNFSKVCQLLNAYQASSNASEHPQNAMIYLHTGFKRIYLV